MMISTLFDLPYFDFIYVLTLIASVVAGYLIARYRYFSKQRSWKSSGVENAIIGFYGLLLSFTLAQSGVSNKERIGYVHQEADALSLVYRESFFLNGPVHNNLQHAVINIMKLNLRAGKATAKELVSIYAQTNAAYDTTWYVLRALANEKTEGQETVKILEDRLNQAIAMNYKMQYSHQERTPLRIMVLLIVGSWLIGILIGFTNGFNEEHHFLVPVIFICLTGLTLMAIRDLDNPTSGMIRPSYQNYEDILKNIRKTKAD